MKTYLITGGAGFIGSNFIHYMLAEYDNIKIINVDLLTYAGNLENLKFVENNPHYQFVCADICDAAAIDKIFQEYTIDYVINFAAESHVDRSILQPSIFVKTNIEGTVTLLDTAKRYWQQEDGNYQSGCKFLQISTDEVYGSLGSTGLFTETTPLNPHSPYSASKASADLLVQAYFDTYQMPVNITRSSNNYGAYQFPEKLIPLMINNALAHKPLPIYGDGKHVRDWLFVQDHCRAIDLVIQKGSVGEVYNIGSNNEYTNIEIVKLIINYISENMDSTVNEDLIEYVADRKGHDRRYGIDPQKIKNLGWSAKASFEDSIKQTIQWYVDNKQWLKNITSGEYQEYYKKMYGD